MVRCRESCKQLLNVSQLQTRVLAFFCYNHECLQLIYIIVNLCGVYKAMHVI